MTNSSSEYDDAASIHGAQCAIGAQEKDYAVIQVACGQITHVIRRKDEFPPYLTADSKIDLSGFLLLPGLVNAHDHLQFALHPRLGAPPHQSYVDWGEEIHARFADVIATHKSVPRDVRLWWGGIRNLLCGVTTVCHHDKLWPELQRKDFPVKVVQQFVWGHSLALGGDLHAVRSSMPEGTVFILHAGEGVDERARNEVFHLEELGLLDASTVLVHGLAMDGAAVDLLEERGTSLIVCPSSNKFLFGELPNMSLFSPIKNVALGSDSPLTATGDLLDEIRFALKFCGIAPTKAYRMVTEDAANILKLKAGEGTIRVSGPADLIAIRDNGQDPADRLQTLSMADIEFVMVAGRVQLASEQVMERLPFQINEGLEPLVIDGILRWLRAPVGELLRQAEEVIGTGNVRFGGRRIGAPVSQ